MVWISPGVYSLSQHKSEINIFHSYQWHFACSGKKTNIGKGRAYWFVVAMPDE